MAATKSKAPAETEVVEEVGKTFSAKQVATRIGTDAKTFRKFLRSKQQGVGQGGRYEFSEGDLSELKASFDTWKGGANKLPRTTTATPSDKLPVKHKAAPVVEEVEEILELEDEEPSDEDLADAEDDDVMDLDFEEDEDE